MRAGQSLTHGCRVHDGSKKHRYANKHDNNKLMAESMPVHKHERGQELLPPIIKAIFFPGRRAANFVTLHWN